MKMIFNKKTLSLFLTGVLATKASVCKPKSGSCDECTGLVGTAKKDGTLFCSNQLITTTDRGIKFEDGYVLWYQNIRNCGSPCFDEDSSDDSDDDSDDDESTDDEDEEGSDVCYSMTKTCCPDSLSTVKGKTTNSDGKTYCVKYQAEEVDEGIFYTYPDGKTNTKWWKNIYPCEENRRGLCHYDESDDGPLDQVVILDDGSKGNANNACYPLNGGQTQCFDPTHPVEVTCSPGVSTNLPSAFPGCCPTGIYIGTIPGMACSPSEAASASGKLCYPLDGGGTKCYDPGNPEQSSCTFPDGKVMPGCCPTGVTSAVVPGMTCAPSDSKASSSVEIEVEVDVEVDVESADDEPEPQEIVEDNHDHFDVGNETCSDNIRAYACDNPDFTVMCDLIGAFDVEEKYALQDLELTAFFPTDEAFADLFAMDTGDIELTDDLIFNIFLFHFSHEIMEDYFSMECGSKMEMANGKNARMKCEEKGLVRYMVGGGNEEIGTKPMIVYEDDDDVYGACNGMVFAVDAVMLPGNWEFPPHKSDPAYIGDSGPSIITDSKGTQITSKKKCYPFSNDNCKYDPTVDKVDGCYYKSEPTRTVNMCCPSGQTKGYKQNNEIVCPVKLSH